MSAHRVVEVMCDGCQHIEQHTSTGPPDVTIPEIRRYLKANGWRRTKDADYCPDCAGAYV